MPAENKFSIRLSERSAALVQAYAQKNHLSMSEVICMVMDRIIAGRPKKAGRRTRRLSFYDPTATRLSRVVTKASVLDTTATALVNVEIEEMFGD